MDILPRYNPLIVRVFEHPIWRVFGIFLVIPFWAIDILHLITFWLEKIVPLDFRKKKDDLHNHR